VDDDQDDPRQEKAMFDQPNPIKTLQFSVWHLPHISMLIVANHLSATIVLMKRMPYLGCQFH
jgi:hypothetical protein